VTTLYKVVEWFILCDSLRRLWEWLPMEWNEQTIPVHEVQATLQAWQHGQLHQSVTHANLLSFVHTSNNVKVTLLNVTSRTIFSIKSNVALTLLLFLTTMSNENWFFWQGLNKLNMFNLFRLSRKVEILRKK